MNKNLLSLNDLSKDELLSLLEISENFFNEDGGFKKEALFPDKTMKSLIF